MKTSRKFRQQKKPQMKKITLSIMASAVGMWLFAQTTITNGNMESWTGSGSSIEPTQWNSNKSGGGNAPTGPQTCFKETNNPHGGLACAKVKTGDVFGIVVNGSLTTGKVEAPSFSKSEGYIHTISSDPSFRMAFTGKPDSLVFWYRYTPSGTDYPRVEARLHVGNAYAPEAKVNNNHPDSTVNIIARAEWQGGTSTISSWTRVALPFIYVDGRTPEYILITSTSSGDQGGGVSGSTLWLDDFEVIYNPTIATGIISPLTYYVSATAGASVNVPFTLGGTFISGNTVTAQLSDASGSFASPVSIGSATATTSGTINATIPAGTAAGTAYRIRVVSSNPALTAAPNASNITIIPCSNSIAPAAAQNLVATVNGNLLSVTETPTATSREWKYSNTSGSGYVAFGTAETGTSYIPNFSSAGTYYVVCVSTFPGSLTLISNEVQVNIVANSIAPASAQSILTNTNGNQLTVTESPAATSREWKYSTNSGSGYVSFGTAETGTSYTPNFSSAGNYYIICQSVINGLTAISNEVLVSVSSVTLSTGPIAGSPFEFSPNATDASVSVNYTTSSAFNGGNVFSAQLSDANGSFASATLIGSITATGSGSIAATIPANTPAGTGYRIRVVANNPSVFGTDNGTDLIVDQFHNSVAPATTQTIAHSTNGTPITVTASQSATQEWKYSTNSGSGYGSFGTAETGNTYTPNFATPGTYYVVCLSVNQYSDTVTSNEVEIVVQNGTTINTSTVSGSPFLVSPSATVQTNVTFTSDVVFNGGNVFKAQLSDENGSFSNPVEIGTLNGSAIGTISATIPNGATAGSAYRIRVVSTDPAITGTDNGNDLQIVPFEVNISPSDTQWITAGEDGNAITAIASQPCTYHWLYSEISGLAYSDFNPVQTNATYLPNFAVANTYYVICKMTNSYNDEFSSQEVVIIAQEPNGIGEVNDIVKVYAHHGQAVIDLRNSEMSHPSIELINVNGQIVFKQYLQPGVVNTLSQELFDGVYLFCLSDGNKTNTGKLLIR